MMEDTQKLLSNFYYSKSLIAMYIFIILGSFLAFI